MDNIPHRTARSGVQGLLESLAADDQRDLVDQRFSLARGGVLGAEAGELGAEAGVVGDVDVCEEGG